MAKLIWNQYPITGNCRENPCDKMLKNDNSGHCKWLNRVPGSVYDIVEDITRVYDDRAENYMIKLSKKTWI